MHAFIFTRSRYAAWVSSLLSLADSSISPWSFSLAVVWSTLLLGGGHASVLICSDNQISHLVVTQAFPVLLFLLNHFFTKIRPTHLHKNLRHKSAGISSLIYQEGTFLSLRTSVLECYAINTGIKITETFKSRIKKIPTNLMDLKASPPCSGFSY